jgi:hypothetical protein
VIAKVFEGNKVFLIMEIDLKTAANRKFIKRQNKADLREKSADVLPIKN